MSNNRRKRVSQRVLHQRRMIALISIIVILIVGMWLLISACSSEKDDDIIGDIDLNNNSSTTTSTSTTTNTSTDVETFTDDEGNTYTSNVTGSDTTLTTTADITEDEGDKVQSIELTFYACELEIGEKQMPWVTMLPETADPSELWESSDTTIATVDNIGNITGVSAGTCFVTVTSVDNPEVEAQVKVTVKAESTTTANETITNQNISNTPSEATYIQGILIANKTYALPSDYDPGLDSTAFSQFNSLVEDAASEGLNIWLASGYRSYYTQESIYNNYVSSYGQSSADTFSARPGHSEHQTGLAIDVNSIDDSFANTPESPWLAEHCHEYGFIIRYPKGKEHITGYKYEPWHIRYLGVETATAVYNSGLTLEEYLGIDSQYQY